MAERVRFELTVVLPTHAFQACALNHSAISPPRLPMWPRARRFSIQNSGTGLAELAGQEMMTRSFTEQMTQRIDRGLGFVGGVLHFGQRLVRCHIGLWRAGLLIHDRGAASVSRRCGGCNSFCRGSLTISPGQQRLNAGVRCRG